MKVARIFAGDMEFMRQRALREAAEQETRMQIVGYVLLGIIGLELLIIIILLAYYKLDSQKTHHRKKK